MVIAVLLLTVAATFFVGASSTSGIRVGQSAFNFELRNYLALVSFPIHAFVALSSFVTVFGSVLISLSESPLIPPLRSRITEEAFCLLCLLSINWNAFCNWRVAAKGFKLFPVMHQLTVRWVMPWTRRRGHSGRRSKVWDSAPKSWHSN